MRENALTSTIPTVLGKMTPLLKLYLDNSNLECPLSTEFGALSILQELRLWKNNLSGPIPTEFGTLWSDIHLPIIFESADRDYSDSSDRANRPEENGA